MASSSRERRTPSFYVGCYLLSGIDESAGAISMDRRHSSRSPNPKSRECPRGGETSCLSMGVRRVMEILNACPNMSVFVRVKIVLTVSPLRGHPLNPESLEMSAISRQTK